MNILLPSKPQLLMSDQREIEQKEGALTYARIEELERAPVEGKFDAAHLKEVHRRIFQDLPHHGPGEFRQEASHHIKMRALEAAPYRYNVHYANRKDIDERLEKTLAENANPKSLKGLNADQFSERMSKLYGDLDHLHPFKEGNSRTLRTFTSQIAWNGGQRCPWPCNTNGLPTPRRPRCTQHGASAASVRKRSTSPVPVLALKGLRSARKMKPWPCATSMGKSNFLR